jgi:hypothetical protein
MAMSILKQIPQISPGPETCTHQTLSERDVFLMLQGIAGSVQGADEENAYGAFMHLMERIAECRDELAFKARLFAQALIKAVDPVLEEENNLYLRQYERSHIDLFNLLADRFPPMTHTSAAANAVAARLITAAVAGGSKDITLLDLGIGSGRQIRNLIHMLAECRSLPSRLTIIGVDPMERNLDQAGTTLSQFAAELGTDVRLVPVRARAEDLSEETWAGFRRFSGELFATATFSLHHIGRDKAGVSLKDTVLRNLKRIEPTAFVLTEANGDFETDDLVCRFVETWKFYGSCFDILDRMELPADLRAAAKLFFGRELEDILGCHSAHRCERFETMARWRERLDKAGFTTHPLLGPSPIPRIAGVPDGLITPVFQDDWLGFAHERHVIAAVMCVY